MGICQAGYLLHLLLIWSLRIIIRSLEYLLLIETWLKSPLLMKQQIVSG